MSSCLIQLDNFQGLYCAGNTIQGRVICTFNSPKHIRGIKVKLKGQEHNSWTKTESYYDSFSKRNRTRTVHYSGQNTFVRFENILCGEGDVVPGRYEYPFSIQIPYNSPGTYKGQYGGIYFTLNAKVDRPYKSDFKDSIQLIVTSLVDFNQIRGRLQLDPVAYSIDKTLCCWCCASGPITMSVHLEKEAFVVGEVANVMVEITNMSNENIEGVNVKLSMKVESRVTYPHSESRYNSVILAMMSDTGVGAHGDRTYNFALKIPDTTQVPNFEVCHLFSQRTKLQVTGVIPGAHSNMKVKTFVTMGHIPIYGTSQNTGYNPPSAYPPNMYPPPHMYPPTTHPTIREGINSPTDLAAPEGAVAGPSAPPVEGAVSALSRKEVGDNEAYVADGADEPFSHELPPPSYSEAVSTTEKY